MKVRQVWEWLNKIAPFDSAESFDNVGLLMGDMDADADTVLFGMDVTDTMAEQAIQTGAQLIVTHHPFIFHPLRRIDYTAPQGRALCRLAGHQINVIGAHTNWDKAEGGVSDTLAGALGLMQVQRCDDFLRLGQLPQAVSTADFTGMVRKELRIEPRVLGPQDKLVRQVAVAGGAYGEAGAMAASLGADAFVVGEIRHHELLDACARGLTVYDAGHFASEWPGVKALYERFLADAQQAGWPVKAHLHCNAPYAGALLAL